MLHAQLKAIMNIQTLQYKAIIQYSPKRTAWCHRGFSHTLFHLQILQEELESGESVVNVWLLHTYIPVEWFLAQTEISGHLQLNHHKVSLVDKSSGTYNERSLK